MEGRDLDTAPLAQRLRRIAGQGTHTVHSVYLTADEVQAILTALAESAAARGRKLEEEGLGRRG